MKKIVSNWFFVFGLLIKIILIFLVLPIHVEGWYVPFIVNGISTSIFDPWTSWVNSGGELMAFPYGFGMWIWILLFSGPAYFFGIPLDFAYDFMLLIIDFLLLVILYEISEGKKTNLIYIYWLSPVVILASYGLGLNDLVPVFFLVVSIFFLKKNHLLTSGIFCGVAISAKLSMCLTLPLFLIFLYNKKSLRQFLWKFAVGFILILLTLGLPFFFTEEGIRMLASTPGMRNVFNLSIPLNDEIVVYLIPLFYSTILYLVWRLKRINFELFQSIIGLSLFSIMIVVPESIGWFIWSIPFLSLYQAKHGRKAILLVMGFSMLYLINILFVTPIELKLLGNSYSNNFIIKSDFNYKDVTSAIYTILILVGFIIAIRILRESVNESEFFRLSRRTFVLGIAGDSGSGKDTLANALTGLFGNHSVSHISGDDYHLWDRQKPMWNVMTHLNPMANELEKFAQDVITLVDGKSILKRNYNHDTGKSGFVSKQESNDFILVSGLHALYLPILRKCYDLKIFLDIDEELRKYFKILRDVDKRGYDQSAVEDSIKRRKTDAKKFIQPQYEFADLILSLQPAQKYLINKKTEKNSIPKLKLMVTTTEELKENSIHRALVGICGLHVDLIKGEDFSKMKMIIEGDPSPEDIKMAANILCPRLMEFLDNSPHWEDGMLGVMQLLILCHIDRAQTKSFVA